MSATLNRADRKLFPFSDSDNMPLVALLAKNFLIHFYLDFNQTLSFHLPDSTPRSNPLSP